MTHEATTKEELDDLKKRAELQTKLQEAIRGSRSASEIARIQNEIQALNRKLEAYASRARKPLNP